MQNVVKTNNRLSDFNKKRFTKHISDAELLLTSGKMEDAWNSFHDALTIDFEGIEAKYGMKIAGYWKERQVKYLLISDFLEKGEFLLREFQSFENNYVVNNHIDYFIGIKNVGKWVYRSAYDSFKVYSESVTGDKAEILLKQGYCLKKLGNYEDSQRLLEEAATICRDNSKILSQLADVYSLTNNELHSKLFFREAFFIEPQNIDIDSLESILIKQILSAIENKNYSQKEKKEWIPVYGTILGIFSLKKDLKPMEVGLLKQSIHSLNNQLSVGDKDERLIIPRLINHYFRLLDHQVSTKSDKESIDETLLNIKLLDKTIYDLYLN